MSHDYENQLPPEDSLVEGDELDDANTPPDRPSTDTADALTASERAEGETIDDRLAQEEPDDTMLPGMFDDDVAAEEAAMHEVDQGDQFTEPPFTDLPATEGDENV